MRTITLAIAAVATLTLGGVCRGDTSTFERAHRLGEQVAAIADVAGADDISWRSLSAQKDGLDLKLPAGFGRNAEAFSTVFSDAGGGMVKAAIETIKTDFALTQLRSQAGANFHVQLRRALPAENAPALFIRGGRVTLDELATAAPKGAFEAKGSTYTARWPIVIWTDAELVLQPGERLELEDKDGAFIINAGLLKLHQAAISGSGTTNVRHPNFRPFVTTALTGALQAAGASFSGLGFANFAPMEGVSIFGGALFPARAASFVIDSDFEDAGILSIRNAKDVVVRDNRFRSMRGPAILLHNASRVSLLSNVVIGTQKAQGIALKAGTTRVDVAGNVVLENNGGGIFVANGSNDIQIDANLVSGNGQSGISLSRAACVAISRNVISDNRQGGILIRQSPLSRVESNRLVGNRGMGIAVMEQPAGGRVSVVDNEFLFNRSGLYGASADEVLLNGNDFSGQRPVILDGEFATRMPALLALDARSQSAKLILSASNASGTQAPPAVSPFALDDCSVGSNG